MRKTKNNLPRINGQEFENELKKNNEYILRANYYIIDKNFKCVFKKPVYRCYAQEPTEYIKEPERNLLLDMKDYLSFYQVDLNKKLSLCVEVFTYSEKEKREKVYFVPLKRNILFLKHVN